MQIKQGRIDCMSEVNKPEQNLAYSRAVYLAPQELNCKIEHAASLSAARGCDPLSLVASDLEKQDNNAITLSDRLAVQLHLLPSTKYSILLIKEKYSKHLHTCKNKWIKNTRLKFSQLQCSSDPFL